LDGRADGGSSAVSDDVASAWFDGKTGGTRTGALSFHGQPEGQRIPGFPAAEFNEGDPMTRILWLTLLLALGCICGAKIPIRIRHWERTERLVPPSDKCILIEEFYYSAKTVKGNDGIFYWDCEDK
jgi:hypothetical protein